MDAARRIWWAGRMRPQLQASFALVLSILVFLSGKTVNADSMDLEKHENAIVKIDITYFEYSYVNPWQQPDIRRAGGTGFVISGNRILTNAHVVSQANTIRVSRPGLRRDYEAKVKYIAHDADLAMLSVEEDSFFKDVLPLELGETPRLNTPVAVVGYPIGGDRLSITRGIVSRKDIDTYSHSSIDQHLTIQVDAAINPGNSGGPALQDGKVIGIAFQVLSRGENLGYLIPPPVVERFLRDVEDGTYNGYTEFGVVSLPTVNPVLKKALGLEEKVFGDNTGIFVYDVIPDSTADGKIFPGDVVLAINEIPISEKGDVEMSDGHMVSFAQLVDNLSIGEPVKVELWRDGSRKMLKLPSRRTKIISYMRKNYDTRPEYFISSGLVFQPLNADLVSAHANSWSRMGRISIFYRYRFFVAHELFSDGIQRDVVLTRKLVDPTNLYADDYLHRVVESVDGERVRDFAHFSRLMDRTSKSGFKVIRFYNYDMPLVIKESEMKNANERIKKRYRTGSLRYVENHK